MSTSDAQAAAMQGTSPLMRTFLVTVWSESDGPPCQDKVRQLSLRARDHDDAQNAAVHAIRCKWPKFGSMVWCVSSEELLWADA